MYEVFLRELLEPLGIYDLSEESVSGAEIFALGAGLDTVSQQLERTERGGPDGHGSGRGTDTPGGTVCPPSCC